ncbi:MAG: hypothetical protein ACR2P1_23080 [Pseudomonadales bacterium]
MRLDTKTIGAIFGVLTIGTWALYSLKPAQQQYNNEITKAHAQTAKLPAALPSVGVLAAPEPAQAPNSSGRQISSSAMVAQHTGAIDITGGTQQEPDDADEDRLVTPPAPPIANDVTIDYAHPSKRDMVMDSLNAHLEAQAYDTEWASMTEQSLMQAFYDANLEGNRIQEAVCRSTFCRIDVGHSDALSEQNFLSVFATSGQFINDNVQGLYRRSIDHNGDAHTVFFYARKGYELPTEAL